MQQFKNYIDGQWCESSQHVSCISPSDADDQVGIAHWASKADVQAAADAARRALPAWATSTPGARSTILRTVGEQLHRRADELGLLLAREEGKALGDAIGEIKRSADVFLYYAGEAFRAAGEYLPGLRAGVTVSTQRQPVGVTLLICPWNFPMAVPAFKLGPALAYGNTVILKPSEFTPACAHTLVRILHDAGLPKGVVNLVMGNGAELGDALMAGCDAVSFTGSTGVGRLLAQQAGAQMKKVQLELGGKNPLVVLDDASLDCAVEVAVQGAFFTTGQRCTATSRIIVEHKCHDAFVEQLLARMSQLRVGNAADAATQIGPVANERQWQIDLKYLQIGQDEGATLAAGGQPLERPTPGYFLSPALFTGTHSRMRINQEEIFGPVASVIRVNDLDEAINVANDVEFGLSSGICTGSLAAADRFRQESRAGMVMVNAPTAGIDFHVPFGGLHASGYGGKELGRAAIEFYTDSKTTYWNASGQW